MSLPFSSPVALTSIERLHFFDSSNLFPNRITCRLMVEQAIDFESAKKACYWLGERHPVLGCSIENVGGKLCWVRDPDRYQFPTPSNDAAEVERGESQPWFQVQEIESRLDSIPDFAKLLGAADFYRPCLLIRQWPASNDSVQNQGQSWVCEIWLSIHHAFCDGGGGIQIISDWVQVYENLISGLDPNDGLPTMDHGRFKFRNRLGLLDWKFLKLLPFQTIGLFGATKFAFRKSIQAFNRGANALSSSSGSARVSTWLSAEEFLAIEELSQAENFNSNAKLLGDLFATIQNWYLKTVRAAKPGEWVRIILPINLRDIGDRRLSAANRSSLIQIDRRNLQSVPPAELYRSIQREIGIVLRFQLDRMFLIMIRLIGFSDILMKQVVRSQKPRGIAVYTNLGRPFRRIEKRLAGGKSVNRNGLLDLKEIDFLAPLRFGTPLNFSVAQFQGRLRLTLHYDPCVLKSTEAEELLKDYLDAIRIRPDSMRQ